MQNNCNAPSDYLQSVSKGYHPPDWVNSSVLATMTLISDFTLSLLFNTKEKNRLTAGGCDLLGGYGYKYVVADANILIVHNTRLML